MLYFIKCNSVEAVKTLYRKLALENHPDRGGDTATMQAINAQYTEALKRFDGTESKDSTGFTRTYTYNADLEQSIIDKINEALEADLEGCEIWLIGTWIWIDGNTYPNKAKIRALGFRWNGAPNRKCWQWGKSKGKRAMRIFQTWPTNMGQAI